MSTRGMTRFDFKLPIVAGFSMIRPQTQISRRVLGFQGHARFDILTMAPAWVSDIPPLPSLILILVDSC